MIRSLKQFPGLRARLRRLPIVLMIAAYTLLFCILAFSPIFSMARIHMDDRILQRGISFSDEILVISVTDSDLETLDSDAFSIAARLSLALNSSGENIPAAILIDIPSRTLTDAAEADLLQACSYRCNLILPVQLTAGTDPTFDDFDELSEHSKFVAPYDPASENLTCCTFGHSLLLADGAGIVRHALFDIVSKTGRVYPSAAEATYSLYCRARGLQASLPKLSDSNAALIKFAKPEASAPAFSAADLLQRGRLPKIFSGKIIIIGDYSVSSGRSFYTAADLSQPTPVAEIDANIINALLSGDFALTLPALYQKLLLAAAVLLVGWFLSVSSPLTGCCLVLLYLLLGRIIAMLLFGVGIMVNSLPHAANALITGLFTASMAYAIRQRDQRLKLEKTLSKYVDENIARNIIDDALTGASLQHVSSPEVSTRKIAVLFADIRGFTSISERMPAQQLVQMLNSFLSMMSDCVTKYGGTLDKFIGDCAMGYWGAPSADDDPVYHACLAAAEMQRRAKELAAEIYRTDGIDVHIGIGINYGEAVVGNIGSADRMNFTAVGDSVNIASRLEELAPADCIYLSGAAAKLLGDRAELQRLDDDITLRGRASALEIYSLRSISAADARRKSESVRRDGTSRRTVRSLAAILADFLLLILQFVFVLNSAREYGTGVFAYFPVLLSTLSCMTAALLLPYDIQMANREGHTLRRPHYIDIFLLTGLSAELQTLLFYLVFICFSDAAVGSWPGSPAIYLFCPLLLLLSFLALQNRRNFRLRDYLLAELPITVLSAVFSLLCRRLGLQDDSGLPFHIYYHSLSVLITTAAAPLLLFLLSLLNRRLQLQEKLDRRFSDRFQRVSQRHPLREFIRSEKTERLRLILGLVMSALIAFFSLRATLSAYRAKGIEIYSNPSLVGVVVFICCIVSVVVIIDALRRKTSIQNLPGYRYFSYIRTLGCMINFFSLLMVAVSGEGIEAFFIPHWNADATVFLLCPALSVLMLIWECNEYRLLRCSCCVIPYLLIPILSRAAILSNNLAALYSYEVENFYSPQKIIVTIGGEFTLALLLCFLNFLRLKLSRADVASLPLTVCGNRTSISPGSLNNSEFGFHSDCYVLRDRDYALMLGTGSGMCNARDVLSGCKRLDILLTSTHYSSLMGLLDCGKFCPDAQIRVFSLFDPASFAVNPFWPVGTGLDYHWKKVTPGKKLRLTNDFFVEFIPQDGSGSDCIVKITGSVSVCYLGNPTASRDTLRSRLSDADLMIYGGDTKNIVSACYLAIDCGVSELMITGYPTKYDDDTIKALRAEAEKILPEVSFLREGMNYPVRRF